MEKGEDPWDMEQTRRLVKRNFGTAHLALASESLNSVAIRNHLVAFHLSEAREQHDQRIAKGKNDPFRLIMDGFTNDGYRLRFVAEANILACLQSLHSIADTFDFAAYYSLGFSTDIDPREINDQQVSKQLNSNSRYAGFAEARTRIRNEGKFKQVDALVNHAKHRAIIRLPFTLDLREGAVDPVKLEFDEFKYRKIEYQRTPALEFLVDESRRCIMQVVAAGRAMNALLEADTARASGSTELISAAPSN